MDKKDKIHLQFPEGNGGIEGNDAEIDTKNKNFDQGSYKLEKTQSNSNGVKG